MKLNKSGNITVLRWFLLGLALAMVVTGVLNGEPGTVFAKAVNICLECIGIG